MANLRVNGQERAFDGDPSMPLLWYLRDELGLTGTKFGCGVGAVRRLHRASRRRGRALLHHARCRTSAGKAVTTIEGLRSEGRAPGAGRLARPRRAAMRLLPGRADHAGRGAAREDNPRPPTPRSPTPCPAISAAAAAISASTRPCAPLRRGRDMTRAQHAQQGLASPTSAAAACSRASPRPAASCSPRSSRPSQARFAVLSDRRRGHAERRRQRSRRSSSRSRRTARSPSSRPAPRWAPGRAHRAADDRRRRARRRLGARARRAVARRRDDLRQPGHRRLAQRAPLHPADAPCAAPPRA